MMNNETWLPLVYKFQDGRIIDLSATVAVSNYGRLKDLRTDKVRSQRPKGKKVGKPENCYMCFSATGPDGKNYKALRVHRAVASAFVSGFSVGLEIDHRDDNIMNNASANLQWITKAENLAK